MPYPCIALLFLYVCGVAVVSSRERSGFFLEETGSQTYVTHADSSMLTALENQILSILKLEGASKNVVRKKRNERVTSFMSNLYGQMQMAEHLSNCYDSSCSLLYWIIADRIVSTSDPEINHESASLYTMKFPCDILSSNVKPDVHLLEAQLQLNLPSSEVKKNLSVLLRGSGEQPTAHVLLPGEREIAINITKALSQKITCDVELRFSEYRNSDTEAVVSALRSSFIIAGFQEGPPIEALRRAKRSAPPAPPSPPPAPTAYKGKIDAPYDSESGPSFGCGRKGLYVDFKDLGWSDWLIAPPGYGAYMCSGACSFPLHNKMNATNHAIVQTLAHLVDPQRADPSRCAPLQLAPVTILFIDNHNNVIMKRYRDMIVQECGCQ